MAILGRIHGKGSRSFLSHRTTVDRSTFSNSANRSCVNPARFLASAKESALGLTARSPPPVSTMSATPILLTTETRPSTTECSAGWWTRKKRVDHV
ncbi:hypothetical protein BN6_66700 [Saccharothrix espanaensis DSM 44229]|uniref:Uncharacterized protein n=1 Tax=Saccharothrix espanaensis (strain ATCC 51144 / DSM 44229 / JCM 9112 / NBRC 15066 / NRRL 15764) TaxID=1179773 RepID=K0K8N7_SACES|nr:hypothetical protein BN6_66700 [Saccharothrix espanaensis DSM 44229]